MWILQISYQQEQPSNMMGEVVAESLRTSAPSIYQGVKSIGKQMDGLCARTLAHGLKFIFLDLFLHRHHQCGQK